jgi:hypothetical protein
MTLDETLSEGGNIRDGLNITKKMWNRTFHGKYLIYISHLLLASFFRMCLSSLCRCSFTGITGHVRIDDNGDRDADYSILDLDPITGRFEVVAHYRGLNKYNTQIFSKLSFLIQTSLPFILAENTPKWMARKSTGLADGTRPLWTCHSAVSWAIHPNVRAMTLWWFTEFLRASFLWFSREPWRI